MEGERKRTVENRDGAEKEKERERE